MENSMTISRLDIDRIFIQCVIIFFNVSKISIMLSYFVKSVTKGIIIIVQVHREGLQKTIFTIIKTKLRY